MELELTGLYSRALARNDKQLYYTLTQNARFGNGDGISTLVQLFWAVLALPVWEMDNSSAIFVTYFRQIHTQYYQLYRHSMFPILLFPFCQLGRPIIIYEAQKRSWLRKFVSVLCLNAFYTTEELYGTPF